MERLYLASASLFCAMFCTFSMWFRFLSIRLSFNGLQAHVLGNGEHFDDEAIRVVVNSIKNINMLLVYVC